MPFRVPSADPGRVMFLLCCIGLAGLGPLYVWWNGRSLPAAAAVQVGEDAAEELLALRAENRLLLMMLGGVEGRVMVLGPTEEGGAARGKVAWDEARQAGFLHVSGLPPQQKGSVYALVAVTRQGQRIGCGPMAVGEDGKVAVSFVPEKRLLGVERFEVVLRKGSGGERTEQVLVRGGGGV